MNFEEKTYKKINLLKDLIIFTLLIIYSFFLISTLTNTNLVANPSFESGAKHPLNWEFVVNDGNYPIWDNVNHSGTKSIKISFSGKSEGGSGYPKSDLIKVEPQQFYTFSTWGKTENASEIEGPAVRIVELDANKNWIDQINLIFSKGTNDWTQKKIDFKTDPNTTYIYIYANIWRGYGTFWVDDVDLRKNTTILPTLPKQISSPTYFVAIDGNDYNPGTESQPWRTITKAVNVAVAGDTVYVKEGNYNEKITVNNSGSPGNFITFMAYPGHTVTIDGTGLSIPGWEGLVEIRGKSYINISGFRIVNSTWAGVFVTMGYYGEKSSYITIEKNYIYNTYGSGILMQWGNNYIIDNNEIELACNAPSNIRVEEIISIQNHVDTFEVRNNYIHDGGLPQFGGEGIDAKWNVSNGKIYNNHIHDVRGIGIYIDSWVGSWYWGDYSQIGNGYARDIDVFSNRVYNVTLGEYGTGLAISAETGGIVERINVYNNIIYNNGFNGIMIPAYSGLNSPVGLITNVSVINNVFYNNLEGGADIGYWPTSLNNVILRNNIFSQNQRWQVRIKSTPDIQNIIMDHNLIDGYRNFTQNNYYTIKGSNHIEANPQFIDVSKADFHLHSTSFAIDKGSSTNAPATDYDGNTRPKGNGYDIGAYEYGPTLIPTPISDNSSIYQ